MDADHTTKMPTRSHSAISTSSHYTQIKSNGTMFDWDHNRDHLEVLAEFQKLQLHAKETAFVHNQQMDEIKALLKAHFGVLRPSSSAWMMMVVEGAPDSIALVLAFSITSKSNKKENNSILN